MKKGWKVKKLDEICELSAGGDVPRTDFSKVKTEMQQIPIYSNGEKDNGLYGYTSIAKVEKPSITVSARGTIGFTVKRLESFFPVVRLIVVTPKDLNKVDLSFLDYSLRKINFHSSGSSIPQLTVPMIREYSIPLPPLPEQHRIVSILDHCFEAIDKAKANAERNLQNAKELFESYLQGVFEKLYKDYELTTLDDSCKFFNGKAHERDIDSSGEFIVVNSKFISREGRVIKKTNSQMFPLYKNDITMVMSDVPNGKALAKCYIIEEDDKYSLNQRICCIRSNKFDIKFLYYNLNRHPYLLSFNNGENQSNLRKGDILKTPLSIPPIDIQQAISDRLEKVKELSIELAARYQITLDDLEELKKSILQKAFAGELKTEKMVEEMEEVEEVEL